MQADPQSETRWIPRSYKSPDKQSIGQNDQRNCRNACNWSLRDHSRIATEPFTGSYTGSAPTALEISRDEIDAAYGSVDEGLVGALLEAADRIRDYHQRQKEHSSRSFSADGIGMQVRPIERVGMYVPTSPGAVYPSVRGGARVQSSVIETDSHQGNVRLASAARWPWGQRP